MSCLGLLTAAPWGSFTCFSVPRVLVNWALDLGVRLDAGSTFFGTNISQVIPFLLSGGVDYLIASPFVMLSYCFFSQKNLILFSYPLQAYGNLQGTPLCLSP